ncbi:MAG: hypothetical protein ABI661_02300 [Gammaproteobacteria bacterium]
MSFLRGPYNLAFYRRHNRSYRISAGMHFFHSKQHDLLLRTRLAESAEVDATFEQEAMRYLVATPRTEPDMAYYSEYVDRAMHLVFRTIDWTHMHHEQTYDVLAHRPIAWAEKKKWTDRSVAYYLREQELGVPRSPAPLDVTMRRAAVMMKPYFTYFRNYYPKDQALFYVAHWWHPAVYEAIMIGGADQESAIKAVDELMYAQVIPDRPQRMILSREVMPRYSRLSPESANIFDNLHMLHGIVYDILAYERWSVEEKRAELYRVIKAMGYQPGDEALARKFALPHADHDPRTYPAWVRSPEGEMSRIMMEMMTEMMPMMMPGMAADMQASMMAMFKQKMALGLAPGETPGSLHDAMAKMMPGMKMMPGTLEPGVVPPMMVETMLNGWRAKHGAMPDVEAIDMSTMPSSAPLLRT